jgi:hypothetical protein
MPGITQKKLEARLDALGGELGGPGQSRHKVPGPTIKTPYIGKDGQPTAVMQEVPGPDRWVIETPHGDVTVEPQPDGTYTPISQPNPPAPVTTRGQPGEAPIVQGDKQWTGKSSRVPSQSRHRASPSRRSAAKYD